MSKIDKKKKEKKESLLATAFELFTTSGFNKTSISDISKNAGVGKGTFYLYFRDKYDIRNKLIAHKSNELFNKAHNELLKNPDIVDIEDKIIFIVDYTIDELKDNQRLLNFISKNLGWGIFKNALTNYSPADENEVSFLDCYLNMINDDKYKFKAPEVMLFLIIELVSSTCYSAILYNEPLSIDELKPYLYTCIRNIIKDNIID